MSNEDTKWVVLKFGGTSVATVENWENIISVIRQRREEGFSVCVVHSALSGISDSLEEIIEHAPGNNTGGLVQQVKERHYKLGNALELPVDELLGEDFHELEHLVKGIELIGEASYRVQARLLAIGELMATKLGAAYVRRKLGEASWIDSRDYITTRAFKNVSKRSLILSAVSATDFDESVRDRLDE